MRFADFCFRVENSGVALGVEGAGFSELGVARVSVEGSGVTFRKPCTPMSGHHPKVATEAVHLFCIRKSG